MDEPCPRGSYGRFYQGVLTGEISPFIPARAGDHDGVRRGDRRLHDVVSVVDPTVNLRIDRARGRRAPTSTRSASIANGGA